MEKMEKNMKISIVNGSPREKGATGKLLREAQTYLESKENISVQRFDLAKLEMKFCKGCIACYKTGTCIIKDDGIEEIAQTLKNSDGVILGSPTYGSNVSGYMKNFMDRGHFIVEQGLYNKYGFSLATYEIADGGQTLKTLQKFFLVSGASRRGKLLVKVDFNKDPLTNSSIKNKLHRKLDLFTNAIIRKQKRTLFERLFNDTIVVNTIWKPHFLAHPKQYAGAMKLYEERNIHKTLRPV